MPTKTKDGRPSTKGGNRRMGAGRNYGKGQGERSRADTSSGRRPTGPRFRKGEGGRKVDSEQVTRPSRVGSPGRQALPEPGGRRGAYEGARKRDRLDVSQPPAGEEGNNRDKATRDDADDLGELEEPRG